MITNKVTFTVTCDVCEKVHVETVDTVETHVTVDRVQWDVITKLYRESSWYSVQFPRSPIAIYREYVVCSEECGSRLHATAVSKVEK